MSRLARSLLILAVLVATPAGAEFNGIELQKFSNISATPATFTLRGGQYAVTLQRQAADGATMVTCLTAFSADGYATVNLPSGTYQLTIATATGVYADVTGVVTVQ